jgi:pimeloyl-ACP methyl ester carboxylesterase
MTNFPVNYTDANGVAKTTYIFQTDNTPDPSLPVILLLHGAGGNLFHMANPEVSPGIQFDVDFVPPAVIDRGWHAYPNLSTWSIFTSPPNNTPGLQGALEQFGFTALNYAQVGPDDTIDRPVVELDAVMREVLARFNKRVALVCHSRGGLLARHFLQRNRNDLNVLSRIAGVVTLHTPHTGSEVAEFANSVHNVITGIRNDPFNPIHMVVPASVLDFVDAQVMNPCTAELRPSSTFLANLRASEQTPLRVAIPIHTFGGTNPCLLKVFFSIFEYMSAVPQWHWPPFHWTTAQVERMNILEGTPASLICPEERAGGDVLVTDARSHLPGEVSHHTNGVNHANALNNAAVQHQLRSVLATMRSNASCVAYSIPPSMIKGTTYPVSITMKNTGTSTWISGVNCPFRLGAQSEQDHWGINRKEMPGTVAPGGTATFEFNVTAPSTAGTYNFQCRMLQENVEWFGAATPNIQVLVTPAATVSGLSVTPISLTSGSSMTIEVTLASAAPAGGVSVMLASSNPAVVLPPSILVVPAGATSARTTTRAASVPVPIGVTLTATVAGSTRTASVMVSPSAAYPYGTAMAAGVGGSLI